MGRVCEKAPYGWLFLSLFLHGHLYFVHQYHLHQGLRHWCGEANLLGSSRCRYLLFGSLWNELVFQSWTNRVLLRLLELRWYALHLDIYRKCCLSKCGWPICVGVQVLDDDHFVFGSHQDILLFENFWRFESNCDDADQRHLRSENLLAFLRHFDLPFLAYDWNSWNWKHQYPRRLPRRLWRKV